MIERLQKVIAMLDNSKKEYVLSELLAMTREELLAIAAEMIQAMSDEECHNVMDYIRDIGSD